MRYVKNPYGVLARSVAEILGRSNQLPVLVGGQRRVIETAIRDLEAVLQEDRLARTAAAARKVA